MLSYCNLSLSPFTSPIKCRFSEILRCLPFDDGETRELYKSTTAGEKTETIEEIVDFTFRSSNKVTVDEGKRGKCPFRV